MRMGWNSTRSLHRMWYLVGIVLIALPGAVVAGSEPGRASVPGSISGTVTVLGDTVQGVEVIAELVAESPETGEAMTGPDGTYQITGLTPGNYIVQFNLEEHLSEWYDNRFSKDTADLVVVEEGTDTADINADLSMGGSISGRVGDDHAGLSGQHIEVYDLDGNKLPNAETTDEVGEYTIGSLIPGTYKVRHMDEDVWYSGKSSFATADVVDVVDDQTTAGVDFIVDTTGSISGTVIGEYFGPVPDVDVALLDSSFDFLKLDVTDFEGRFSFEDVPSGIYYLFATDTLGDFADAWHPDADMPFGVIVGLKEDVVGKDIFMEALTPGGFTDINGNTFEADIVWLAFNGITKGCNPPDNDEYCPGDSVTRGQMAAFLVRALGLTDRLDDPFTDDDGNIFEADIEKLAAAGITRGCNPPDNDQFCPGQLVTRGQMAAFLVRALGLTDRLDDPFTDDDGNTFEADIEKLAAADITRGCNPPDNDRFCPGNSVTRGQMAAFLHRASVFLGG